MRASHVLLSASICVGALALAGCGDDDGEPPAPPAALASTQATVASKAREKLDRGQPTADTLRKQQARFLAAARRALDRQELTVVVSEPATVLVRTKLSFSSGTPTPSALRRLRGTCRQIQGISSKVSVLIAGAGDRELLRCAPRGR